MRSSFFHSSRVLALGAGLLSALPGCSAAVSPQAMPDWLRAKIEGFTAAPQGSAPDRVLSAQLEGRQYFYIPGACCDQFNGLYDESGQYLCAPDGGFSGRGDGKCSDASRQVMGEKMHPVWQDPRGQKKKRQQP